jgi:hypothetical protein
VYSRIPNPPEYQAEDSRINGTRYRPHVPVSPYLLSPRHIMLIGRTLKNTARVYKNAVSSEVVRLERRPGGAKFEELRELVSGARGRKVYEDGDPEAGVWSWVPFL